MSDTLREVAQEAVAKTERSTFDYKTDHGKQVAGALRAEADKDVFTTLQIAAGEQVSPAILRANLEVSIGILKKDGKIDHRGPGYQGRYDRAVHAIDRADKYFDDQVDFGKFLTSPEGKVVVESTGKFLLTHPALTEYFANITNTTQRENAAKLLAEQYLQDPFARERVRQALLESQMNKGDIADEYSEVARKRDALAEKVAELEAKIKKLEGDSIVAPPVIGEIEVMSKRRREFDRYSDPVALVVGSEFGLSQSRVSEIAGLSSDIMALDTDLRNLRSQETALQNEQRRMQRILDSGGTPARDPADVGTEILTKQGEIAGKLSQKNTKEGEKATKEAEIKAIEAEKKELDEKIKERIQEAKLLKDELTGTKNEHDEQVLKLKKMEAAKGRTEELAVAEIENIFKKGVEQELMDRLDRAKAAADKAMEESAAKEKDIDEKQYLELRAKRHKDKDGKINGKAIIEDFTAMKKDSTEYHVIQDPADKNKVLIVEMPANGWPATGGPSGSEKYYLTGPEFALLQMMNNTNEFGGGFMLGKLKDTEWMKQQSQDFASQVLREKMYASRGWLRRRQTGVKRLTSAEIVKIKNSTWGGQMLENALEANKAKTADLDKALGSELLTGPGSWREKLGKLSNKQIGLLMLLLGTSGALLAPALTFGALGSAGSALGTVLGSSSTAGAIAGGGAGLVIGHAGRSRTT